MNKIQLLIFSILLAYLPLKGQFDTDLECHINANERIYSAQYLNEKSATVKFVFIDDNNTLGGSCSESLVIQFYHKDKLVNVQKIQVQH